MNAMVSTRPKFGKVVGYAEYHTEGEEFNSIGEVVLHDNGVMELAMVATPVNGVLELQFSEDVGEFSREVYMVKHASDLCPRYKVGRARVDGLSGNVVFFAQPLGDSQFIF